MKELTRWARGLRVSILAGEGEAMVKEYGNFGFSELLGSVSFGSVGIEWGSWRRRRWSQGTSAFWLGADFVS